ncbi:hypothetical protein JVX98_13280 [Ensifer sp. PDNC004]|uniref:DUF6362 family protein n=1 Tax=Ensifer sp. PDNC004 TaxID=2811423 RepID=UPI0019638B5C|nr:DUF6362 family protein [Ensifer sp. PDNC004]QRY69187.1 hypothetical protein JVX98_13280 [Ensifer sp. PDNC004]
MSQSNALRFDDMICEEMARIADAVMIVRARFIEAADTMAHLDVRNLRPAAVRSFWPTIQDETVGGHAAGYDINGNRVRYTPSSAAISRAEEVMYGWLLDHVQDDERRILLGKWSMCMASPKQAGSFRQFCQKTGRSRSTAERRLNNEFQNVSSALIKNAKSLHEPNWSRVVPMVPNWAIDPSIVARRPPKNPTHMIADDGRPSSRDWASSAA